LEEFCFDNERSRHRLGSSRTSWRSGSSPAASTRVPRGG
jgi:hypothetical protein